MFLCDCISVGKCVIMPSHIGLQPPLYLHPVFRQKIHSAQILIPYWPILYFCVMWVLWVMFDMSDVWFCVMWTLWMMCDVSTEWCLMWVVRDFVWYGYCEWCYVMWVLWGLCCDDLSTESDVWCKHWMVCDVSGVWCGYCAWCVMSDVSIVSHVVWCVMSVLWCEYCEWCCVVSTVNYVWCEYCEWCCLMWVKFDAVCSLLSCQRWPA